MLATAYCRKAASGLARTARRLAGILACVPLALCAAQPALPLATDLAADAQRMRAQRLPMVVLYSQADCSYCEQARIYLVPMSGSTPASALFRQVDLDSDAALVDFAGRRTSHREVARSQRVGFTPTVVVYDAAGRELGERIVGMRLPDFYGQYIDNAIEAARTTLGAAP